MKYQTIIKALQAKAAELADQYQLPEAEPQKLQKLQTELPLLQKITEEDLFSAYPDFDEGYLNLDLAMSLGLYSALDYTLNGPTSLTTLNDVEVRFGRKELEFIRDSKDYYNFVKSLCDQFYAELDAASEKDDNWSYKDTPEKAISKIAELYQQLAVIGLRYYQKENRTQAVLSIRGHQLTEQQLQKRGYLELAPKHWLKHFFIDNKVIRGMCLELELEQGRVKDYEITYRLIPSVFEMTDAQERELNKWLDNSHFRKEIVEELEELKKL